MCEGAEKQNGTVTHMVLICHHKISRTDFSVRARSGLALEGEQRRFYPKLEVAFGEPLGSTAGVAHWPTRGS
jgi:hypothetical protein